MRLVALAMIALLAGCVAQPAGGFRDASVLITSTTRFEAARFAGPWVIRAAFAEAGAAMRPGSVAFHVGPSGDIAMIDSKGVAPAGTFGVRQVMPGRLTATATAVEYWVLWVDADYRTAAIGTPSGAFGWIIDRSGSGGDDRIKAAADIFNWVGYDMTKLVELP